MRDLIKMLQEQEDFDDPEVMQAFISSEISEGIEPAEMKLMLEEYARTFGEDFFWKMTSFDVAEMTKDTAQMRLLLDSFEADEISPVMRDISEARICLVHDDYVSALKCLNSDNRLEDNEEALMYLHIKGISSFAGKNYKEAARCLEDVLMDFHDLQMMAFCAISYLHLGKNDRAAEYFAQLESALDDEDYEWLSDLIYHFSETSVLENPVFPEKMRERLIRAAQNEAPSSLGSLENMIRDEPEEFEKFLRKALKNGPEDHMLLYLYGIALDELGEQQAARRFYRKAMLRPCKSESSDQTCQNLEIRLYALDRLDYTPGVKMKHLRTMLNEIAGIDRCRIDLMLYCSLESLTPVLKELFENYPWPQPGCRQEKMKLECGELTYYCKTKQYREALGAATAYFRNHPSDLFFNMQSALVFAAFRPDIFSRIGVESPEPDFEPYLQDLIVQTEMARVTGDADEFAERLLEIHSLHISQTSEQLDTRDWMLFGEYISFLERIGLDLNALLTLMGDLEQIRDRT